MKVLKHEGFEESAKLFWKAQEPLGFQSKCKIYEKA
jgi:hypothetical protein